MSLIKMYVNFAWHPINRMIGVSRAVAMLTLYCSSAVVAASNNNEVTRYSTANPWWQENSRWTLDFSTRPSHDFELDEWSSQWVAGFDYHKVFSTENGDIGTLVFQPYWVQLSNVSNPPPIFDDGDDGELTWRIANFNYTALSRGGFNIRLGHFEVPFGLEQNLDTNGTTRQYTFSDRGIKADWGVSLNGALPVLDYEVALTRGSGNETNDRDSPYIFAGRVGTPSTANLVVGLSWLHGDIQTAENSVERRRLGVDVAYYYRQWETLFEVSGGDNEGTDVANALLELSWRSKSETLHTYLQVRQSRVDEADGRRNGSSVTFGANWSVFSRIDLSAQWFRELDPLAAPKAAERITLQARYRL
ncbi:MAG: hypothetical protein ACR2PS_10995 [Pseudomonadales bacterium]